MKKAESPNQPLKWIQENFVLGGHKAAAICKVLKKAEVYLVSSFDRTSAESIFLTPASSVAEALDSALIKHGNDAKVLVILYANSTLPYV